MEQKIVIGINQRIPISLLEMALLAALQGDDSPAYFAELASTEYDGENRIKKAVSVINRLTIKNPLFPYMKENKEMIIAILRNKADRPLLFSAIISAAYSFGYDTLSVMGKFFHAQEQISTSLITQKLAGKYGSNRSLPNAMNCVIPMFLEAGIIVRPQIGIYEAVRQERASEFAVNVYKQAFLVHNPNYTIDDILTTNSYFEFIQ